MTKLPTLSSKEVIKALRSAGFENAPKRGKGSHIALVKKELDRIELNQRVCNGMPVIKGTRFHVSVILEQMFEVRGKK